MQPQLFIQSERLDLYPDESINLNQSVQSLRDLTKVFTDFTKSFKVPANAHNNAIFKHYYKSQIDDGYDARTKVAGRIDINGITFKYGKIQLNSVGIKSNVPEFYDIEFFGNTIEIKELIGDDTLRDLTSLSDLDFDYTAANVYNRLQSNQDISFAVASYDRRFIFRNVNQSTDNIVNIAYNSLFTDGIDWKELKGFIKLRAILEAIETEYPRLNFSRDFFGRSEFTDLYMSLGIGTDKASQFDTTSIGTLNVNTYTALNYILLKNIHRVNCVVNSGTSDYRLVITKNGERIYVSNFVNGSYNFSYEERNPDEGVFVYEYLIESNGVLQIDANINFKEFQYLGFSSIINEQTISSSITTTIPQFDTLSEIANIKVLDWFTAIIKAFNLIIQPQQDGTLLVNDLNSWYKQGNITDVSEYIDIEDIKVERGELFKEIEFKYEDSEQILAAEYESQFGKQFGAEEISLEGLATDDTLEIELPFENPQFERLDSSLVQYAYIVDKDQEPYKNKPFLCYLPTIDLGSTNSMIGFNTEDAYTFVKFANIPSHSQTLEGGFTAQFAAEFSEYNGSLLSDNLYSRFYSDYFNDLFDKKRRKYTIKAQFTPTLLTKIAMNDRLIIKGERYLIDNVETNITTGATSLVLLNDLFTELDASDTSSSLSSKSGVFNTNGSFYYSGKNEFAIAFTDSDWITIDSQPPLVNFTLSENKTGQDRAGLIQIQDGLSDPSFLVFQPAGANSAKFDSTTITFDNTITTF
ncbi:hypothetical protein P12024L_46 [Nonlabens phage P12024L]|uniref:Uncharacterized protein n=1 Tax=Nonlabens phage P12024L TaxID=1168479 RepID=I6R185_9CAUD|nr:hypothetical protein B618_gp46 [Nonlabens phage P12024L]AFM54766.1 hypothetical protein P12024L_46 [Nonlabens phage P12024L]